MSADAIWKAFAETGEPACYLLYRAMCGETRRFMTEDTVAVIANR